MSGDHNEIIKAVGKLEGSHEALTNSLNRLVVVLDKVDTRLSDVEKKQARYAGYAAGIGAGAGAIIATMAKKMGLSG